MSNLTNSISSLCHQLIEKPTNFKTKDREEYFKVLDDAKNNINPNREIVLDSNDYSFYVNLEPRSDFFNICIKLFETLSVEPLFNDIDKPVYNILHEVDQIVKTSDGWYHIAMQPGDIKINLNETIKQQMPENKLLQKNGAIIKGENCFIERVSPGGRDGERYALIEATQDDLKKILIGLTELL